MKTPFEIFHGSDGEATRELYKELDKLGPAGVVATNLFRACKNSGRAKVYRGGIRGQGSYKGMAYDRKQWAMSNLCSILEQHAGTLGIVWGWKEDPYAQGPHRWLLYVDIPPGQVSFHTDRRGRGPDYPGDWDHEHQSDRRIIDWVTELLDKIPPLIGDCHAHDIQEVLQGTTHDTTKESDGHH
jgi:hypothetical protein